jgi:AcrR family transcriptional regulator
MPRTNEDNQAIKDERKSKIMKASLRLFSTVGYDTVTINDITKTAHCSHGLFYHYFASKEELFHAIMEESKKNRISKKHPEGCDLSPVEFIQVFVDDMIRLLKSDDDECYLFNILLTGAYQKTLPPPPQVKLEKRKTRTINQLLEEKVSEGQKTNDCVPGDPHFLVKLFISTIRGLFFERVHMIDLSEYEPPKKELLENMLLVRKENV